MIRRLSLLLTALLIAAAVRAQGTVTLRPVARLTIGSPVTLADVATLTGTAQKLGDIVLLADPMPIAGADRRLEIKMEDLHHALADERRAATSRLRFSGSSCTIMLRPISASPAPTPTQDLPHAEPASAGLTLRDHIEARLVETLGVPRDRLELTYNDRDTALLSMPTVGWTVDVQPTGSSAKLPLRITMYDRTGGIRDESLRVGVRILRDVVRTTRALRRGATITSDDLTQDTAWLAPDISYVEPQLAVGLLIKRSVGAGELLTSGQVELAEVVKKGDIVAVHVISGSIVIRTPARALHAGRVGDQVEFESLTGHGHFMAEVKAPGRAVSIAGMQSLIGEHR